MTQLAKKIITIGILALALKAASASNRQELWFDKPAANWNEALPIGNGRMAGPEHAFVELNPLVSHAAENHRAHPNNLTLFLIGLVSGLLT